MRSSILRRLAFVAVALTATTAAFGLPWDIDMADSPGVKAYEQKMRAPAPGAVSQANLLTPQSFVANFERATPEGQALTSPYAADAVNLAKGAEMYRIYCEVCHGDGVKLGPVAQPGRMPGVAVLLGDNGVVGGRTDGHIYLTIRNGSALMPRYGHTMTDREMWSVVAWLRQQPGGAQRVVAPPTEVTP
jgi:mono/diheme cytochrome c family protein